MSSSQQCLGTSKPAVPNSSPTPSPPTTHNVTPSSEVKENDEGIWNALILFFGVLFIMVVVGVSIFFCLVAKKKRSSHGVYSPQNEEFKSPIIEMTEIKIGKAQDVIQERLI